jgi:hypothetical protein
VGKVRLSKLWWVRLVCSWSMFNFAQSTYDLLSRYAVESSVAESATENIQIADELILQALCKFVYMFFVFGIWVVFEIAVPFYKIRRRLDYGGRTVEDDKSTTVNREKQL